MRNWSFRKSGVNYNFATTGGKHNQRKKLFQRLRTILITEQLFAKLKQERTRRRERSSYKEHRANALASGAEEGRD